MIFNTHFQHARSNLVFKGSFEYTKIFMYFWWQKIKTENLEILNKPSWAEVNFIIFKYSTQNIVNWQETIKSQMPLKINDLLWISWNSITWRYYIFDEGTLSPTKAMELWLFVPFGVIMPLWFWSCSNPFNTSVLHCEHRSLISVKPNRETI